MSRIRRVCAALNLEEEVDEHAHRYLLPAFNGDVEAAEYLAIALDDSHRGYVAVRMWEEKVARPAFRAFLADVWGHDHAYLIDAACTRRRLAAMFRYADFLLPELPEFVQVWRGAFDATARQAAQGHSWTLDRDVACWFAMRPGTSNPTVITARIQRDQIVHFSNARSEQEVVLVKMPPLFWTDGDEESWRAGHARRCAKVQQHNEDLLKSYPATELQAA